MSLSIFPFLLGRHLSEVRITALSEDNDGILTSADVQMITAQVVSLNFNPQLTVDDGRGVNSPYKNAVPDTYDGTIELVINLRRDQNSALRDAWTYDHHLIEATLASGETLTMYGVRTGVPVDISKHGVNTFRINYSQFVPYNNGEPVTPMTISAGS